MRTWHRHSRKIDGTSPTGKQHIHTLSLVTFHYRYSKLWLCFIIVIQTTVFLQSQLLCLSVGSSHFIRNMNKVDMPEEELSDLWTLKNLIYSGHCQSSGAYYGNIYFDDTAEPHCCHDRWTSHWGCYQGDTICSPTKFLKRKPVCCCKRWSLECTKSFLNICQPQTVLQSWTINFESRFQRLTLKVCIFSKPSQYHTHGFTKVLRYKEYRTLQSPVRFLAWCSATQVQHTSFRFSPMKWAATCAGSTFSSKSLLTFSMVSNCSCSFLNLFFHRQSSRQ